jgi:iron complex transport system substrate-binding protein
VALEQIRESGTAVTVIPSSDHSLAGVERKIRAVGDALGRRPAAEKLIESIDRSMQQARARVSATESMPTVMFIYTRGPGGAQVAGHATAADAMIALAGGRNAVAGYNGYRPLTAEGVAAADPEIILVPAKALETLGGIDALLALPGVAATRAGHARRIVAMDDLELLGFGPRLPIAVSKLIDALHPTSTGSGA